MQQRARGGKAQLEKKANWDSRQKNICGKIRFSYWVGGQVSLDGGHIIPDKPEEKSITVVGVGGGVCVVFLGLWFCGFLVLGVNVWGGGGV